MDDKYCKCGYLRGNDCLDQKEWGECKVNKDIDKIMNMTDEEVRESATVREWFNINHTRMIMQNVINSFKNSRKTND